MSNSPASGTWGGQLTEAGSRVFRAEGGGPPRMMGRSARVMVVQRPRRDAHAAVGTALMVRFEATAESSPLGIFIYKRESGWITTSEFPRKTSSISVYLNGGAIETRCSYHWYALTELNPPLGRTIAIPRDMIIISFKCEGTYTQRPLYRIHGPVLRLEAKFDEVGLPAYFN